MTAAETCHTRTIREGPFWAVMLPDGTLFKGFHGDVYRFANPEFASNWCHLHEALAGRVVRVKSVTYEVEDD